MDGELIAMLVYNQFEYAASLTHIGFPKKISNDLSVLIRGIPDAPLFFDATAAWPYIALPRSESLVELVENLTDCGAVTFTSVIEPDSYIDEDIVSKMGFKTTVLKEHFVCDPRLDLPQFSRKTRYNLSRGFKSWDIGFICLSEYGNQISQMHQRLALSKSFSLNTRLNNHHFDKLSMLENVVTLGAFDKDGMGAALITIHEDHKVHFHAVVGEERAYKSNAFYALYKSALDLWGSSHTIYLGGAPSAANSIGIERFKMRFSNRKAQVSILQAVLDPDKYNFLISKRQSLRVGFFPEYRLPL